MTRVTFEVSSQKKSQQNEDEEWLVAVKKQRLERDPDFVRTADPTAERPGYTWAAEAPYGHPRNRGKGLYKNLGMKKPTKEEHETLQRYITRKCTEAEDALKEKEEPHTYFYPDPRVTNKQIFLKRSNAYEKRLPWAFWNAWKKFCGRSRSNNKLMNQMISKCVAYPGCWEEIKKSSCDAPEPYQMKNYADNEVATAVRMGMSLKDVNGYKH